MANRAEKVLLALLGCLLLAAPLGEGCAAPRALFVAQSAILACFLLALTLPSPGIRPDDPSRKVFLAAVCFVGLACVSAWGSAYPYASFLRILDFFLYLLLAGAVLRRPWSEKRKRLLGDCLLAAAALQALMI